MQMKLKSFPRLALIALLIAWSCDLLTWQKAPGISFFILVVLCLAGGLLLTWQEGLRPARASLILLVPVLGFAAVTFLRREPFTVMTAQLLTLYGLALLAVTWLGGRWFRYSLSDHFVQPFRLAAQMVILPIQTLLAGRAKPVLSADPDCPEPVPVSAPAAASVSGRRTALSIFIGLLLALPVVAVLAALLAAADPFFSSGLNNLLGALRIERLGEYVLRLTYILILAYLLAGVFLYALLASPTEKLIGVEKPWLPPFLGWLESTIVLGSVNLLFAFFVAIQFRYFFGGQQNITVQGYTYAEYARRGFGEMLAVAIISLLLFLGLSMITRRVGQRQRRVFSGLGIGLVALVAVILVSAFQRLLLYEAAYSFTRIRTLTHVFMIWLGLLLVATVVLELLGRTRGFALAALLAAIGFGATISLLNVDGFIARQNIARAAQGAELDSSYLVGLSADAAPSLVEAFQSSSTPANLKDELGAVLACRAAIDRVDSSARAWPSYVWPDQNARWLYGLHQPELAAYPVRDANGAFEVQVNGVSRMCLESQPID